MPFRSGKKKSGVRMTDNSRSNTARVSQAGRGSRGLGGKIRGSESSEVPLLTVPILQIPDVSAIADTTATGTTGTNTTVGSTFYWVVDELAAPPSVAQIKLGQNSAGGAADDADNAVAANPNVSTITGLTAATDYTLHCYQENTAGGSAVVSSAEFTTLP